MKWICIVEDEPDLNRLMQFYLEKEGYSVISCSTFAEARQQLNSDISVWVVDIMLPDGSGLDILKLLKVLPSKSFPTLLCSISLFIFSCCL